MVSKHIGLIGIGNMGTPMATRLVAAGHTVSGFDLSADARGRLAEVGGTPVESVTDMAGADVIILMLPNSKVVEAVLTEQGLLGVLDSSTTIVDMSSSEPLKTQELSELAAKQGITLIDAPVSGGVSGAKAGTLSVMVGGTDEQVASVRDVLEVFGKVTHTGKVGSGHAVKALNNLLSAVSLLATSEAMYAGIDFGVDPKVMLEVINKSSGRSGSTDNKWPNFILTETFNSGFGAGLMLKDMKIATDLTRQLGRPTLLGSDAFTYWEKAVSELPAGADHTEIARWLAEQATE